MALDDLDKDHSGVGLQRYWKDLFPERETKLYVYKGTNQLHRGKNIFSREDDISIISLELIDTVSGIFGGEALTINPLTVEEDKSIKEIELTNIMSQGFTAFLADTKHDYRDQELFFTIGQPFVEGDINKENLNVLAAVGTSPNIFAKLVSGFNSTDTIDNADLRKTTISWTLSPAVLQNNLPSSKILFADSKYYKQLPENEKDFEITSIVVESDHSFMPEYGHWIQAKGILEGVQSEETDISFKMNKPLLPIKISPYAKENKVEFIIKNFIKYQAMPWLYAKHFLGNIRTVEGYIKQGSTEPYVDSLVEAVVNMFKMSQAFNTGFKEYRDDTTGVISNEQIGGVSLKSLESKGTTKDTVAQQITQVLVNWEYKHPDKKTSPEYIRAIQLLSASSEWVPCEYSFGKVESQMHKSYLDWYLDLETDIKKATTSISMKLKSLRYEFDTTTPDDPKIKGLIATASESNLVLDELDTIVSLPQLDDPISTSNTILKPGDINLKSQDSLKYFVGIDITEPNQIEKFFINEETSNEIIETVDVSVDTPWIIESGVPPKVSGTQITRLTKTYNGIRIATSSIEDLIKNGANIPSNAYDVVIKGFGNTTRVNTTLDWYFYIPAISDARTVHLKATLKRVEGAVVEYKIKRTTHGVIDKKYAYDKSTFIKEIIPFVDDKAKFSRELSITDDFRDDKGNSTVKIKSINRLHLSFFLGNHIDIKINYKHKDAADQEVIGQVQLPRLTLPSVHDETRTKLGIRL